jgi:hypothetical protein
MCETFSDSESDRAALVKPGGRVVGCVRRDPVCGEAMPGANVRVLRQVPGGEEPAGAGAAARQRGAADTRDAPSPWRRSERRRRPWRRTGVVKETALCPR